MDDFEVELRQAFLEEARQLLQEAEHSFLALELNPADSTLIENIFRLAHNLKGSSKAVGFESVGEFTHHLESLLLAVRNGKMKIEPPTVSLLLECSDHLTAWVHALKADTDAKMDSQSLLARIQASVQNHTAATASPVATPTPTANAQSEAAPPAAVSAGFALATELGDTGKTTELAPIRFSEKKEKVALTDGDDQSIRVSIPRLEKLINFVGEMVLLQTVLRDQAYQQDPTLLRKTVHQLGKVTREIRDLSMGLRMVPLKQVFLKMQRIVRDTSASLSKDVRLTLDGEQTEVDKSILEYLSDPLVHLVRNAVDHGIESAQERAKTGKSLQGNLKLAAYHRSGNLFIEVIDDGGGLNPERIKAKAIERGFIAANEKIETKKVLNLIFESGFSTRDDVTEISGRGVGLDVVKTNIEKILGEVSVESEVGKGSVFKIRLPLTLAIIEGMILRCGEERFVIPLAHVHETLKPRTEDIHRIDHRNDLLVLRGETIPLYRLARLLGRRSGEEKASTDFIAIIIRVTGEPFAVLVDDILNQQQVVIKKLGEETRNLRGFTGSTILGDGKPSLILELSDLVGTSATAVISGRATKRKIEMNA